MEGWHHEDGVDGGFMEKLEEIRQGLKYPYNGERKECLHIPPFHPSFANVKRIYENLFAQAAELVENFDCQDAYDQWLLEKIKKHRSIPYEPTERVGLEGDSGVGRYPTSDYGSV